MTEQLPLEEAAEGEILPPAVIEDGGDGMAIAPVEVMKGALADYKDRRKAYLDWIQEQFIEGIHYGVPPGCEPERDGQGRVLIWSKKASGKVLLDPKQWVPRYTLYDAGAQLIIDLPFWTGSRLVKLKAEYETDLAAWEQLGKPAGVFVRRCRLFVAGSDILVAEGTGACGVGGGKGGKDANAAVKMADKCARVAAGINVNPAIRERFTQDQDDAKQKAAMRRTDTDTDTAQPTPPPAGTSYVTKQWNQLKRDWVRARYGDEQPDAVLVAKQLPRWVASVLGRDVPDPKTLDGEDLATLRRWLDANGCKYREEVE